VDAEDVGEGPRAEGVDKGNVGVDAKDVSEALRAEVLAEVSCCSRQRYVTGADVEDAREAPLANGIEG
jgi:hypothetical protein